MKTISIVVPCYNEEKSVHILHDIVKKMFSPNGELSHYDYELIYADDFSTDNTREELRKICKSNPKAKAILNAKNFGFNRNVFYALQQGTGDAVFMVFGDLQDPPELLPEFVNLWESGRKLVIGQKLHSDENKFVYKLRSVFYKTMDSFSQVKQIQHFNGYGLYDKIFIDVIKEIDDPNPYLKGIVGEFGMNLEVLQYNQKASARGNSNFNFSKYYDVAMLGITAYTKTFMRIATFVGITVGMAGLLYALFIFVNKIQNWDTYPVGIASIIILLLFLGAIQLCFLGIMGEYILSINTRTLRRPLVVPSEKLNFHEDSSSTIEKEPPL